MRSLARTDNPLPCIRSRISYLTSSLINCNCVAHQPLDVRQVGWILQDFVKPDLFLAAYPGSMSFKTVYDLNPARCNFCIMQHFNRNFLFESCVTFKIFGLERRIICFKFNNDTQLDSDTLTTNREVLLMIESYLNNRPFRHGWVTTIDVMEALSHLSLIETCEIWYIFNNSSLFYNLTRDDSRRCLGQINCIVRAGSGRYVGAKKTKDDRAPKTKSNAKGNLDNRHRKKNKAKNRTKLEKIAEESSMNTEIVFKIPEISINVDATEVERANLEHYKTLKNRSSRMKQKVNKISTDIDILYGTPGPVQQSKIDALEERAKELNRNFKEIQREAKILRLYADQIESGVKTINYSGGKPVLNEKLLIEADKNHVSINKILRPQFDKLREKVKREVNSVEKVVVKEKKKGKNQYIMSFAKVDLLPDDSPIKIGVNLRKEYDKTNRVYRSAIIKLGKMFADQQISRAYTLQDQLQQRKPKFEVRDTPNWWLYKLANSVDYFDWLESTYLELTVLFRGLQPNYITAPINKIKSDLVEKKKNLVEFYEIIREYTEEETNEIDEEFLNFLDTFTKPRPRAGGTGDKRRKGNGTKANNTQVAPNVIANAVKKTEAKKNLSTWKDLRRIDRSNLWIDKMKSRVNSEYNQMSFVRKDYDVGKLFESFELPAIQGLGPAFTRKTNNCIIQSVVDIYCQCNSIKLSALRSDAKLMESTKTLLMENITKAFALYASHFSNNPNELSKVRGSENLSDHMLSYLATAFDLRIAYFSNNSVEIIGNPLEPKIRYGRVERKLPLEAVHGSVYLDDGHCSLFSEWSQTILFMLDTFNDGEYKKILYSIVDSDPTCIISFPNYVDIKMCDKEVIAEIEDRTNKILKAQNLQRKYKKDAVARLEKIKSLREAIQVNNVDNVKAEVNTPEVPKKLENSSEDSSDSGSIVASKTFADVVKTKVNAVDLKTASAEVPVSAPAEGGDLTKNEGVPEHTEVVASSSLTTDDIEIDSLFGTGNTSINRVACTKCNLSDDRYQTQGWAFSCKECSRILPCSTCKSRDDFDNEVKDGHHLETCKKCGYKRNKKDKIPSDPVKPPNPPSSPPSDLPEVEVLDLEFNEGKVVSYYNNVKFSKSILSHAKSNSCFTNFFNLHIICAYNRSSVISKLWSSVGYNCVKTALVKLVESMAITKDIVIKWSKLVRDIMGDNYSTMEVFDTTDLYNMQIRSIKQDSCKIYDIDQSNQPCKELYDYARAVKQHHTDLILKWVVMVKYVEQDIDSEDEVVKLLEEVARNWNSYCALNGPILIGADKQKKISTWADLPIPQKILFVSLIAYRYKPVKHEMLIDMRLTMNLLSPKILGNIPVMVDGEIDYAAMDRRVRFQLSAVASKYNLPVLGFGDYGINLANNTMKTATFIARTLVEQFNDIQSIKDKTNVADFNIGEQHKTLKLGTRRAGGSKAEYMGVVGYSTLEMRDLAAPGPVVKNFEVEDTNAETELERQVRALSVYGCFGDKACIPDLGDRGSIREGSSKRMGTAVPEPKSHYKYLFPIFVDKLFKLKDLSGCVLSEITAEVEKMLNWEDYFKSLPYTGSRRKELAEMREKYLEYDSFDFADNDEGKFLRQMFTEVEAHVKWESYQGEKKFIRLIFARVDYFKVAFGQFTKIAQKVLYDKLDFWVTQLPVADLCSYLNEKFANVDLLFATDFSAFESHSYPKFMADVQEKLWKLIWLGQGIDSNIDIMYDFINDRNNIKNKFVSMKVDAKMMSGELVTSLMNSVLNWALQCFIGECEGFWKLTDIFEKPENSVAYNGPKVRNSNYNNFNQILDKVLIKMGCSSQELPGISDYMRFQLLSKYQDFNCVEFLPVLNDHDDVNICCAGDDGLIGIYTNNLSIDKDKFDNDYMKQYGINIKLDVRNDINSCGFLSKWFTESGNMISDPLKHLAKGVVSSRYIGVKDSLLRGLALCRAMSLLCQFPKCPILSAYARYIYRMNKHIDKRRAVAKIQAYDSWEYQILEQALNKTDYERVEPIQEDARDIIEINLGIPPMAQVAMEEYFDNLDYDVFPGEFNVPYLDLFSPEANVDFYFTHVIPVAKGQRTVSLPFNFERKPHEPSKVVSKWFDLVYRNIDILSA